MDKVYGAVLSPFVRKVLMVLEHKGVDYDLELVLPFNTPEEYTAISPLRKVPGYADEEVTLCDSSVIADYLEHKYPQSPLYPSQPAQRARALWLEEFADTKLMEHLGPPLFLERIVAPVMMGKTVDEEKVQRSIEAMPPWLDYLEQQLDGKDFLLGSELTIADLSVPSIFLNARYADYDVDAERWPVLAAYLQRMYDHPLYARRIEEEAPVLAGLKK